MDQVLGQDVERGAARIALLRDSCDKVEELLISVGIALFSFIAWYGDEFDRNRHWKIFKITFPIALISALGLIFIPSTKDALIIYGIGGTVEYLRDNPTARQLPDKCVEALGKFVDEYLEEE